MKVKRARKAAVIVCITNPETSSMLLAQGLCISQKLGLDLKALSILPPKRFSFKADSSLLGALESIAALTGAEVTAYASREPAAKAIEFIESSDIAHIVVGMSKSTGNSFPKRLMAAFPATPFTFVDPSGHCLEMNGLYEELGAAQFMIS